MPATPTLTSVQGGPAPATPSNTPAQPTPAPTATEAGLAVIDNGAPLPPQVVAQRPSGGEELPVNGEIELTFDQPMDAAKTAAALHVTAPDGAAVAGKITWPDSTTLLFKPNAALLSGDLYSASLDVQAASAQGVTLQEPYDFQFVTTGELQVSQVFPMDGAKDVASDAVITVIFNRPVVPLVIAEERTDLPDPLTISPETSGKGEWVNTSVYAFRPDKNLKGGVKYSVTVKAGLADSTDESHLAQAYTWQFSTSQPSIKLFELSNGRANPEDNYQNFLLDDYFRIYFMQPMQRDSTEAALSLVSRNGEKALLTTLWNDSSTTLIITPTQHLSIGTAYTLKLDANALADTGSALKEGLSWNFKTVPPPAILSTRPANGARETDFNSEFNIKFASPMRIDTVKSRIVITPKPEKDVEWWYNDWEWSISGYFLQPSTTYEIRMQPGMEDIYGNKIQTEKVVRFTTAPRQPEASLVMPYDTAFMRAGGPPEAQEFYAAYANVKSVKFGLYSLTAEQFMSLMTGKISSYKYQPASSSLVWSLDKVNGGKQNERTLESYRPQAEGGKPLAPGFYFLTMDAAEVYHGGPFADFRLLIVASSNLTFKSSTTDGLVWLTDMETGKPVADAPVKIYDDSNQVIGQGSTDKDGKLYLDLPAPPETYATRFAIAGSSAGPGQQAFGFASTSWGSGVNLYDYGAWSNYYAPANQPTAYVYTERPIYRPGQPVYYKGIVRVDKDLDYSLLDYSQVTVRISSFEEKVYEEDLPLSSMGTFDGKLILDNEAALGYYTIEVLLPGQDQVIGSLTFNVAEYRKPEFQVTVSASPKDVLGGEDFTASVQATYYSGGGVANATVEWTLTGDPFTFTPPDEYSSYNFNDNEQDVYSYNSEGEPNGVTIAQGKGVTDAQGRFTVSLPADLSETGKGRTLTFEATVTDLAMSTVSGRDSLVAHRSRAYPGVRPKTYVGFEGEEQTFQLIALDWSGNPLPGQKFGVEIVERRWYSVQEQDASGRVEWKSTVEDVPAATISDVTADDKGMAEVSFTPAKGGIYRATVTAPDEHGNTGRSYGYLWVASKEYIPWQQTNDRSFELVTDKKSYLPGDTAQIMIASPFQGETYALVTVERGRLRKQEVLLLTSNSTIYKLPITADLAPNAYVSVVVVKGVDDTNPWPNFKMGITEIKVDTRQQTLSVEVIPDRQQVGPGEQVQYTVRTRDAQGKPVSAEVSLSLSDLATLSLLPPNSLPILKFFYSERTLGVWTSVPLVNSLDEYNINIVKEVQQGGGGGGGGGKGEGDLGVVEVRQEFPDTAFWDAAVQTDADGEATVRVTLPDNLTTWRMDARAVTLDTHVGQTTDDIVSSRPLLVRPQTPRFFIASDQARLGTAVHNNTDQALSVVVSLQAEGLTLQSPISQTVQIEAKGQAYVSWNTTVDPEAARVDLVFSAEGGGFKDASRPPQGTLDNQGIPVYRYEAPETVGTSGQMTSAGSRVEAISLPQSMQVSEGELTIKVSPSLAASMTDGLEFLKNYPYDCIEQTISRFLPNVISTRAMKEAGIHDPALEAGLQTEVQTALQRLYNAQNPDGGWGWWATDKSDPFTSAYVVLGLVEAQASGYTVNSSVLERGLNYLRVQVVPIVGLKDPFVVHRQAFILYVLARAGTPNVSSTVQLYDQRQRMAIYAQAYLTQALYLIDNSDPRLKTLLSDFASRAILSATGAHWEEKEPDRWNWNTDTRTTAIVLSALSQIDSQNPLNANAVRWLMSHRTGGHWKGTQETAWTLMALTNWMVASGELKADYEYGVALNGKQLGGGVANQQTLRQTLELKVQVADLLTDQINRLAFARSEGTGNLYYTAHLNVSLPVEEIKSLDQGIIVSRSYYRLSEDGKVGDPVSEAKQGEQLLVRLTIVAPNALHYVMIEDPLPAGLEAVDQSLATSPQSIEVPQAYSYNDMIWRGWGWWYFSHVQYRDEKVVLSASYLPAGAYVYTYLVRAGTVGAFRVIPTTAQEFYFPEVYGRGEGTLFTVTP
jgi:uncharacterized protein YfaS (alpha-2-macroglobulin family)